MNNGTRKTTRSRRNSNIIQGALQELPDDKVLDDICVLDIGSSNGIDAYFNYKILQTRAQIKKYVLGDLYTEILYDSKRKLIFDQDGKLLQVLKDKYFVSIYFQYTFKYQKITNVFKRIRPYLLKKQYKFDESQVQRIPLVHPDIQTEIADANHFDIQRLDITKTIFDKYDIILCFHLLTEFYFGKKNLVKYRNNLISLLNPGGLLILGTSENHEIISS